MTNLPTLKNTPLLNFFLKLSQNSLSIDTKIESIYFQDSLIIPKSVRLYSDFNGSGFKDFQIWRLTMLIVDTNEEIAFELISKGNHTTALTFKISESDFIYRPDLGFLNKLVQNNALLPKKLYDDLVYMASFADTVLSSIIVTDTSIFK